jgi:hypothetical protein
LKTEGDRTATSARQILAAGNPRERAQHGRVHRSAGKRACTLTYHYDRKWPKCKRTPSMYGRTCDTEPGRFHTPAAAQSRQSFAARARVRPARSATAASATRVVRERPRGSGPSRGRVCLSSANIHRNVLNTSYDRMYRSLSTFSGDGHLMTDSPTAIRAAGTCGDVARAAREG